MVNHGGKLVGNRNLANIWCAGFPPNLALSQLCSVVMGEQAMKFGRRFICGLLAGGTVLTAQLSWAQTDEAIRTFEAFPSIATGIFQDPDISEDAPDAKKARAGIGYESNIF